LHFIVRAIEFGDRQQRAPLWRAYLDFYLAVETPEITGAVLVPHLRPAGARPCPGRGARRRSHRLLPLPLPALDLARETAVQLAGPVRQSPGAVGRALISAAAAAKTAGAAHVYWSTHETNAAARRLYDSVAERTVFIQYRIDMH
jgi:hypothetical protein